MVFRRRWQTPIGGVRLAVGKYKWRAGDVMAPVWNEEGEWRAPWEQHKESQRRLDKAALARVLLVILRSLLLTLRVSKWDVGSVGIDGSWALEEMGPFFLMLYEEMDLAHACSFVAKALQPLDVASLPPFDSPCAAPTGPSTLPLRSKLRKLPQTPNHDIYHNVPCSPFILSKLLAGLHRSEFATDDGTPLPHFGTVLNTRNRTRFIMCQEIKISVAAYIYHCQRYSKCPEVLTTSCNPSWWEERLSYVPESEVAM
ncbi:hypothetical protein ACSQ67_001022 [Phaseolus vulgaris]